MSLNLIPRDTAAAWPSRRRFLAETLLMTGLVGAGSACARAVLESWIQGDADRLAELQTSRQARLEQQERQRAELQAQRKREQTARAHAAARARAVALPATLQDIADRLPTGVALSSLEVRDGRCRIHGVALRADAVAEYAGRLQAMKVWSAPVELGPVRRWIPSGAAQGLEGAGVTFEIQAPLQSEADAGRNTRALASGVAP